MQSFYVQNKTKLDLISLSIDNKLQRTLGFNKNLPLFKKCLPCQKTILFFPLTISGNQHFLHFSVFHEKDKFYVCYISFVRWRFFRNRHVSSFLNIDRLIEWNSTLLSIIFQSHLRDSLCIYVFRGFHHIRLELISVLPIDIPTQKQ